VFFYKNLSAFVASDSPEKIWLIPTKGIAQLVANETAFSVLDVEGKVYTWGDPRHGLGREVHRRRTCRRAGGRPSSRRYQSDENNRLWGG
jgi:alpha-tubulin suppressor-like RCC1 family protein